MSVEFHEFIQPFLGAPVPIGSPGPEGATTGLTEQQVDSIRALPLVRTWDDFLAIKALISESGRSLAHIMQLAAYRFGGNALPTLAELTTALESFSLADIQAIEAAGLGSLTDWSEIAAIAPGCTCADDITHVAFGRHLTGMDVTVKVNAFARTLADDESYPAEVRNWYALYNDALAVVAGGDEGALGRFTTAVDGAIAVLRTKLARMEERVETDPPADTVKAAKRILDACRLRYERRADLNRAAQQTKPALAATLVGVIRERYKAIVLDLTPEGLITAYGNSPHIVADYLGDPETFNACFDGTNRFVKTFGSEDVAVLSSRPVSEEELASEVKPKRTGVPFARQAALGEQLAADLREAADSGAHRVFRVHLGGHGFTLVVHGQLVYHFETLAGLSDVGTLKESIDRAYHYSLSDTQARIRAMTCTVELPDDDAALYKARMTQAYTRRERAAAEMGWNAIPIAICEYIKDPTDEAEAIEAPKASMAVYWSSSALVDPATLRERLAKKTEQNELMLKLLLCGLSVGDTVSLYADEAHFVTIKSDWAEVPFAALSVPTQDNPGVYNAYIRTNAGKNFWFQVTARTATRVDGRVVVAPD